MSDRDVFMALTAGRSKMKGEQLQCLEKACFLVHRWKLLDVTSHGGRGKAFLWGLFKEH